MMMVVFWIHSGTQWMNLHHWLHRLSIQIKVDYLLQVAPAGWPLAKVVWTTEVHLYPSTSHVSWLCSHRHLINVQVKTFKTVKFLHWYDVSQLSDIAMSQSLLELYNAVDPPPHTPIPAGVKVSTFSHASNHPLPSLQIFSNFLVMNISTISFVFTADELPKTLMMESYVKPPSICRLVGFFLLFFLRGPQHKVVFYFMQAFMLPSWWPYLHGIESTH